MTVPGRRGPCGPHRVRAARSPEGGGVSPEAEGWGYPVHPGAAKLPMMSDAELDELAADIKANGLRWRPTSRSATPTHCARSPSRTAG